VIPDEIRQRLGLKEGTQFVVVGERDVVILKSIAPPAIEEFDELVRRLAAPRARRG
jgi:AbrB family looped-hinge helix DNA binding protein